MKQSFLRLSFSFFLFTVFLSVTFSQNYFPKNKFFIGAQGAYLYPEYYTQYGILSYNASVDWGYSGDYDNFNPGRARGGFFDLLSSYIPNLTYRMSQWYENVNNIDRGSIIWGSAKIYRPAMGQRSTYQAEEFDENNVRWVDKSPGYGYVRKPTQVGSDYDETWLNNEYVRGKICSTGVHTAGYIVDSLFENNEQSDVISRMDYGTALYSDQKRIGDNFRWYVKPRMRIDSNFANNQANRYKRVCRIEIYNFSSRLIDSVTIYVDNFLDLSLHYDGRYIENFLNRQTNVSILSVLSDSLVMGADTNNYYSDKSKSKVDYKIYWYGEVTVHLDYVRLDDEWAHFLFTANINTEMSDPNNRWKFLNRIQDETEALGNTYGFGYFYNDEFYYNHIPCMSEVNRRIKAINPHIGLVTLSNPGSPGLKHPPDPAGVYEVMKQSGMYDDAVMLDQYPITLYHIYPPNLNVADSIKNNYITTTYYQKAANSGDYNQAINNIFESTNFSDPFKAAANIIKQSTTGTVFVSTVQAHSVESNLIKKHCTPPDSNQAWEIRREPTNEEISLQVYYSLCYGAKQIYYFQQFSFEDTMSCNDKLNKYDDQGITGWFIDVPSNLRLPRYLNYYGQRKWDYISHLDTTVLKIGRYMYDENKLVYDNTVLVNKSELPYAYINNLKSYSRNIIPPGYEWDYTPQFEDSHRYWTIGFFNDPQNTYSKYFTLVNMRCIPEINLDGDLRTVKLYLEANQLPTFNTWVIKEVISGQSVTFDKNNITNGISLPMVFQPGEGKLFKLAPVMQEGGTLLTDENFAGVTLNCIGVVNNGNHNITIGLGTTINFKDTAKISMDGGTFLCGNYQQPNGPRNIHFTSSYSKWDGLEFDCCDIVNISNSVFENIKPSPPYDSINYAVKLISCFVFNISNNTFTNNNNFSSGAIEATFYGDVIPIVINPYIASNTFDMNSSNRMIVKVQSYASNEIPILIERNIFNSTASTSQAVYLSGVTGGIIKDNTISGYKVGINALASSLDIFGNSISSSLNDSYGIYGCAYTSLNMSTNGPLVTGGYNELSNTGASAYSLNVENSYFFIDNGDNIFNIIAQNQGKHVYGYFPPDPPADVYATNNCFEDNGSVSTPVHDVTWGAGGEQVNFIFTPLLPNCMPGEQGSDFIVDLGNGVYDTITMHSGSGGSIKGMFVITAKSLYDSICIETRKRNYGSVKSKCTDMLNMFPDSIQSLDAISKLYLGVRMTDTSSTSMTALKTFYESLILNNPNNIPLVKKCNYMVQKCKVQLRQYTSAMTGFQQIINENPYSFEGLVAKWDYMATHLLDSLSAGGESGEGDDPHDKFTKEQRQKIKSSIGTALDNSKIKQEKEIENLIGLASVGDLGAAKILQQKMVLKNIIKTEHPHNISEHIRIVNSDIRKLYGQTHDEKGKNQNTIPSIFRLSQNYPNPFNPVTKIQYDLPKDVKVKLIIYDILGREVIRLVNNEFKQAGRYTVEFNGNNYASGVYFYRIETGEFVQSKKMVMVK